MENMQIVSFIKTLFHIYFVYIYLSYTLSFLLGNTLGNMGTAKKRLFSGVPPPSNKGNNKIDACRKSN